MKLALYKGTRPGLSGLFNILTRWWTGGKYSHVELVFFDEDGSSVCASSSFLDGGVRLKRISLRRDRWDLVSIDTAFSDEAAARQWFEDHQGEGYDVLGLVGFLWRRKDGRKLRWTCSESCGAALGLREPWRFCPNALASVVAHRR